MAERTTEIEYWGAGFPVRLVDFPAYKEDGVFVPDVAYGRLHRVIALHVVEKPQLLIGAEVGFLRGLAELNRSEAARRLGITRRTLINWEEAGQKPIRAPSISHLGIRAFFAASIFPSGVLDVSRLGGLEHSMSNEPFALTFSDYRSSQRSMCIAEQAEGLLDSFDPFIGNPRKQA